MALEGIGMSGLSIGLRQPEGLGTKGEAGAVGESRGAGKTFAAALESALGEIEGAQATADEKSIALVTGQDVAVHDVMASVTEAEIAVQMTTAVAAKAIQAYQEIWRMEI